MKTILCLPAFVMLSFSFNKAITDNLVFLNQTYDSSSINHVLDGSIQEWPVTKFKTDDESKVQYAVDNDGKDLFIALNIPEFRTQVKMMRNGMSLFIDAKGKKKESKGIEFPVKNGNTDMNNQNYAANRTSQRNNNQGPGDQQRKLDIKAMRSLMSLNLAEMKVFGFSDNEPDDQQLLLPGSANIAFSWDTSDVMHIEYLIPLSLLGDTPSLDQKDISIGWKIHAFEIPKRSEGSENVSMDNSQSGRGGGFGGGGHRSGGYAGGGSRFSQADREKMMQEEKFWTKYVIVKQLVNKAF